VVERCTGKYFKSQDITSVIQMVMGGTRALVLGISDSVGELNSCRVRFVWLSAKPVPAVSVCKFKQFSNMLMHILGPLNNYITF